MEKHLQQTTYPSLEKKQRITLCQHKSKESRSLAPRPKKPYK